jgi:hypothetical protein
MGRVSILLIRAIWTKRLITVAASIIKPVIQILYVVQVADLAVAGCVSSFPTVQVSAGRSEPFCVGEAS